MIKSVMDYLAKDQEVGILKLKTTAELEPGMVLAREAILDMSKDISKIFAHPSILDYVEEIALATRGKDELDLGLSPRGAIHLLHTARAHAYIHGRGYTIPDDVKAMAHKVLDHRLILSPEAELGGMTRASITDSILSSVPVPKGEFRSA
jgi:MoxR-like ATPase